MTYVHPEKANKINDLRGVLWGPVDPRGMLGVAQNLGASLEAGVAGWVCWEGYSVEVDDD